MAGLINWKKVAIPSANPDADHVFVGIDIADNRLYVKKPDGSVDKYPLTSELAAVAFSGNHNDLSNKGTNTHAQIDSHIANTSNPHNVTKAQVGLSNADNTSDANKPVSTAQQAALDLKANLSLIGAPSGIAGLDAGGKVPASQLPSYVDDVLEYANLASFPVTGESGKIYLALDTLKVYRWTGSTYVEISASPGSTDAVPEGVTNKYFTESRVLATVLTGLSLLTGTAITAADSVLSAFGKLQKQISDNLTTLSNHIANVSNPHAVTKTQVGLSNVDNTSDVNKPVSTAQAAADSAVQAFAIQRSNHTGTQLASTISDFNTAADARITAQKGVAGGIVPLDGTAKIASTYLPSYVDDVLEFANLAAFPVTGETGKIYTALDTGKIYRWSGSAYVEISASPGSTDAVPEGATNLYFTAARVLSTLLTGFVASTNTVVAATDTVLQALQKLQAQVSAREGTITAGTTAQYWRGDKSFQDLATAVRAVVLTGLTFPFDTAVTAADSILTAIGKLQGQIDVWTEIITTADVTNASNTTPTNVTELAIPVVAGRTYRYELTAIFESVQTANGFSVSVNSPDGAVGTIAMTARMIFAADGGGAEYGGAITTLGDLVSSTGVPAANTRYVCTVVGMFVCTTGGTIQPQIRRTSGTGGQAVTLRAGSCLLSREF